MRRDSDFLRVAGAMTIALVGATLLATAVGCGSGSGTVLPIPAVVSTVPADGATEVSVDVIVAATFNQQMNLSTVNESTVVLSGPDGTLVAGTVAYDSANFAATFTPDSPLASNTTYTAGISSGVANVADTPLPSDFTWTFTTQTVP